MSWQKWAQERVDNTERNVRRILDALSDVAIEGRRWGPDSEYIEVNVSHRVQPELLGMFGGCDQYVWDECARHMAWNLEQYMRSLSLGAVMEGRKIKNVRDTSFDRGTTFAGLRLKYPDVNGRFKT